MRRRLIHGLALAALVAAALAGCRGEEHRPGAQASISSGALRDKKFTVGSKEFTEQLVLGQIAIAALEAAGAEVEDETGLAGSVTARRALTSGEIDMYWEYTGTAWIVYFDETDPLSSSRAQYRAVATRDRERNGVAWLAYAPLNNTYAIAVRAADAPRLGVRTVSDFARLARERPQEATICVGEEFRARDDGLPGLERAYRFDLPEDRIFKLDEGLVYEQVADGKRCNFGSVFATDARIDRLKWPCFATTEASSRATTPRSTSATKWSGRIPRWDLCSRTSPLGSTTRRCGGLTVRSTSTVSVPIGLPSGGFWTRG